MPSAQRTWYPRHACCRPLAARRFRLCMMRRPFSMSNSSSSALSTCSSCCWIAFTLSTCCSYTSRSIERSRSRCARSRVARSDRAARMRSYADKGRSRGQGGVVDRCKRQQDWPQDCVVRARSAFGRGAHLKQRNLLAVVALGHRLPLLRRTQVRVRAASLLALLEPRALALQLHREAVELSPVRVPCRRAARQRPRGGAGRWGARW